MRILDLFCGAGGAAMGLHQYFPSAEIVGVDIVFQPRYPFDFEQADAMSYCIDGYDFVWASPPCQGYSIMRYLPWNRAKTYPLLIEPLQERLGAHGTPYIIENVSGAQSVLQAGMLCGTMFGKRFFRHRLFASNFLWLSPGHRRHEATILGGRMLAGRARSIIFAGVEHGARVACTEMGVPWMTAAEVSQAVPPCYSEYLAQFIPVDNAR